MTQALPFDPVLPQLQKALDCTYMKAMFTKALFGQSGLSHQYQLEQCNIGRIKYNPGKACMIYYTLYLQDKITQQHSTQIVCARFYPPDDSASHFEKAKKSPLVKPQFGEPLVHIPELELILWSFPNDRKLEHINTLMDDSFLQNQLFPSVIAAHLGQEWEITNLNQELVHYAPEHTCTVRAHLTLKRHSGQEQDLTLYGKTYYNSDGGETYRLMQLLWNGPARKQGLLNTAKPLSYHPQYNILWQLGLKGYPLITSKLDDPSFKESLKQVARTIATLHQSPLNCHRQSTKEAWQQKLIEVTTLVSQVKPEIGNTLIKLSNTLLKQSRHVTDQPKATLHGDLHLQNFLNDKGTISLIDLDNICQGSPWQDLGSFSAALYYRGLLEAIPTTKIDALNKIFYEAYAQSSAWTIDPDAIRWYTATALISERMFRSITRLKAGRFDILDDLLALVKYLTRELVSD